MAIIKVVNFKTSIYRYVKVAVLCIALILPFAANSKDAVSQVTRFYKIYWNNIYIADFKVEIGDGKLVSKIDSKGVVKQVSKYENYTYSKFHIDKGVYFQDYFESRLKQRQGTKEARIYYSADGKISTETIIPPESAGKREKVAPESKNGAANPLFAAIVAREKIKDAIANNTETFSFNIYDGKRLSKLDFHLYGKENIKILDKNLDVLKISFKRTPIAGFTKNELKRMKGEEPDFVLYLEEGTLLPVKADAAAPLGKAIFVLEKECKTLEECK